MANTVKTPRLHRNVINGWFYKYSLPIAFRESNQIHGLFDDELTYIYIFFMMQHNELRTSFKSIDLILSPDHG